MLLVEFFELLIPHIDLLHDSLGDKQSFFQLLRVETVEVIDAETLIGLREKSILSLHEAHR